MKDYIINPEGEDPLKVARLFSQSIQSLIVRCDEMAARLEQSELRIKELEQENERLLCEQQKNDLWSSRVTYASIFCFTRHSKVMGNSLKTRAFTLGAFSIVQPVFCIWYFSFCSGEHISLQIFRSTPRADSTMRRCGLPG